MKHNGLIKTLIKCFLFTLATVDGTPNRVVPVQGEMTADERQEFGKCLRLMEEYCMKEYPNTRDCIRGAFLKYIDDNDSALPEYMHRFFQDHIMNAITVLDLLPLDVFCQNPSWTINERHDCLVQVYDFAERNADQRLRNDIVTFAIRFRNHKYYKEEYYAAVYLSHISEQAKLKEKMDEFIERNTDYRLHLPSPFTVRSDILDLTINYRNLEFYKNNHFAASFLRFIADKAKLKENINNAMLDPKTACAAYSAETD